MPRALLDAWTDPATPDAERDALHEALASVLWIESRGVFSSLIREAEIVRRFGERRKCAAAFLGTHISALLKDDGRELVPYIAALRQPGSTTEEIQDLVVRHPWGRAWLLTGLVDMARLLLNPEAFELTYARPESWKRELEPNKLRWADLTEPSKLVTLGRVILIGHLDACHRFGFAPLKIQPGQGIAEPEQGNRDLVVQLRVG